MYINITSCYVGVTWEFEKYDAATLNIHIHAFTVFFLFFFFTDIKTSGNNY